jgi:hypothetical protein
MEDFAQFNDISGIIIYLEFTNNHRFENKYYLRISNQTKFNPNTFTSKFDYICINNITCLKKIPLAFIKSKDKEVCRYIINKIRELLGVDIINEISGTQIFKPSFINIQNIYEMIAKENFEIIKTEFQITVENDLKYNNILIIKDLINNIRIKYKNDRYKNDSDDETDEESVKNIDLDIIEIPYEIVVSDDEDENNDDNNNNDDKYNDDESEFEPDEDYNDDEDDEYDESSEKEEEYESSEKEEEYESSEEEEEYEPPAKRRK